MIYLKASKQWNKKLYFKIGLSSKGNTQCKTFQDLHPHIFASIHYLFFFKGHFLFSFAWRPLSPSANTCRVFPARNAGPNGRISLSRLAPPKVHPSGTNHSLVFARGHPSAAPAMAFRTIPSIAERSQTRPTFLANCVRHRSKSLW